MHLLKFLQQKPIPSQVKVQHVVHNNPTSIYQTDAYGRSPLFLAVYLNLPSSLIRFILSLHPEAVSIPNHMGEMPLHVARTIPIAKLLISMYPGAIHKSTKSKWLPIHTARSSDLTHLFLQEGIRNGISARSNNYKSQTTFFARNKMGFTALETLASSLDYCLSVSNESNVRPRQLNHITQILWTKLFWLTRATMKFYMYAIEDVDLSLRKQGRKKYESNESFKMVHSWIELRNLQGWDNAQWKGNGKQFFRTVLELALDLFPQQTVEKDGLGRTPLIIALSENIENEPYNKRRGRVDTLDFSTHALVRMLLTQSPEALHIPDNLGRLPLHYAVESSCKNLWSDPYSDSYGGIVRDLIMTEPRGLEARDPKTGMFPFMIAAVGDNEVSQSEKVHEILEECDCRGWKEGGECSCVMDKVFFLLRESPSVMKLICETC